MKMEVGRGLRFGSASRPSVLQRRGELGQLAGDLPGHRLGPSARVAHQRLDEDVLEEAGVIGALVQGGERDAAAGGKVAVGAAPAVPHDSGPRHVHHHQIRRRRTRNMRDVIADLAKCLPEPQVAGSAAERLGLNGHVAGLPVVNEVDRLPALAVHHPDRELELVVRDRWQRPLGAQRLEQVEHPGLERRSLVGGVGRPALRERLEVPGGEVGGWNRHGYREGWREGGRMQGWRGSRVAGRGHPTLLKSLLGPCRLRRHDTA